MESWFGAGLRIRMAVGVEEIVQSGVGGRRKCFYDDSGNDLRLRAPGVRWESVKRLRKDVLENVMSNVQEAFDKIYDQITNDRRVSINRHVLPTIKTPCAKKTRSQAKTQRQSSNSSPPPSTSPPPHPLSTLNSSLATTFTPRSVARMEPEIPLQNDIDDSKTFATKPQSSLREDSEDKENVIDLTVSAVPLPKKARGKPKRNATRVEILVEGDATAGRRVTRSSIRGGGRGGTVQRTTRSRAGNGGRKAKSRVSHTVEVIDVESNDTDIVNTANDDTEDAPQSNETGSEAEVQRETMEDSVSSSTSTAAAAAKTPPPVRRSNRNAAKTVRYYDASPSHVASPLLRTQRRNVRNIASPPPTVTSDHTLPSSSFPTHQIHSTTTDFPRPSSSAEVHQSHVTPPCELTATNKTKTDTPHPASLTHSPSNSLSKNSSETESPDTVDRLTDCLCLSGNVMESQPTPGLTSSADKTICSSPPGKWFTSMPTVVKQPRSISSGTSAAGASPVSQLAINAEAAPNEIGNVPHEGIRRTSPAVRDVTGRVLCDTVTKKLGRVSESRDSGISSWRSNEGGVIECRERRSDSITLGVAGGKRLRSVSMEKISLSEVEAKRVSLMCSAAGRAGSREQVEEGGLTDNEEVAMVIEDDVISAESDSSPNTTSDDVAVSSGSDEAMDEGSTPESTTNSATDEANNGGRQMSQHILQQGRLYDNSSCGEDGSTQEEASPSSSGEGDWRSPDEEERGEEEEEEKERCHGGNNNMGDSSPGEKAVTRPAVLPPLTSAALAESSLRRSPAVNLKRTKASPWAFLSHKTHFHDVPLKNALQHMESRPTTFLSPKASPKIPEGAGMTNGSALLHSFLAKSSPQQILKAETKAARQRKLMEHLQRKRDEEEMRKRELEERRLHEVEMRKRRNAERAQKAAEKRRQEEEKKLNQRKKAQV
jgi:hypothetical protein